MAHELVVIEDSDDDFDALLRTCKAVGFDAPFRRFRDAEDALAHLRGLDMKRSKDERIPVLIVLDLNLPGMDGRKLLEILKSDEQLCGIPVVVYTTSSSDKDISFCYLHHANAYHVKPMDLGVLEVQVRTLLDYWFKHVVQMNNRVAV